MMSGVKYSVTSRAPRLEVAKTLPRPHGARPPPKEALKRGKQVEPLARRRTPATATPRASISIFEIARSALVVVVVLITTAAAYAADDNPTPNTPRTCGCRYVIPTFPFTGNTFIRSFWDIATGIGAQAHYQEGGEWSNATMAFGSACGTNGGKNNRGLIPVAFRKNGHLSEEQKNGRTSRIASLVANIMTEETALSATIGHYHGQKHNNVPFTGCDLVSAPGPSDPVLIKTHHPFLRINHVVARHYTTHTASGGDVSNVCGIVLTNRSNSRGWCKSHGLQVKKWWHHEGAEPVNWDDPEDWMAVCAKNVAAEFAKFNKYWIDRSAEDQPMAGAPIITMNFTEMSKDQRVAHREFRALFEFVNVSVSASRFELAADLHLRTG